MNPVSACLRGYCFRSLYSGKGRAVAAPDLGHSLKALPMPNIALPHLSVEFDCGNGVEALPLDLGRRRCGGFRRSRFGRPNLSTGIQRPTRTSFRSFSKSEIFEAMAFGRLRQNGQLRFLPAGFRQKEQLTELDVFDQKGTASEDLR